MRRELEVFDVNMSEESREAREIDAYLTVKRNMEKKTRIEHVRNVKRGIIFSSSFLAGIVVALGASFGVKQHKGTNYICDKFAPVVEGYGVKNDSNVGFIVNKGDSFVSLDEAVNSMIYEAKGDGLTDSEIFVGLSEFFNSDVAHDYIDIKISEVIAAKNEAYHTLKLENSKGVSK